MGKARFGEKNMIKIFSLTFVLVLLISLVAACGDSDISGDDVISGETPYFSHGINNEGFFAEIRALDYVELFDYSIIPIPKDVQEVSDDELDYLIKEEILTNFAYDEHITDRAVEDGDMINIDYVGSIDGFEFDGGSSEGYETIAGGSEFIDDFLTQLIGHMPGDKIDVEVTFPEDYWNEEQRGKDALFVTTVNYIIETKYPELTDEFVRLNFSESEGWNNVDEMKEAAREHLKSIAVSNHIDDLVISCLSSPIPDLIVTYWETSLVNDAMDYFGEMAASYGEDISTLMYYYEGVYDEFELLDKYYDYNQLKATRSLVLQAIAEDAGIMVSEEDMENYFYDETTGSSDYTEYKKEYGLPYLKMLVLSSKVSGLLLGNTVME